jgi:hypothetical protein
MADNGFSSLALHDTEPPTSAPDALPHLALSLYAPWAWAILHWTKRIENRYAGFPRKHLGPIWLHASLFGKTLEAMRDEWESVAHMAERAGAPRPEQPVTLGDLQRMRGHIVGRVTITGYIDESEDGWFCGPTGIVLANPVPLAEPVPCRGALGYWRAPESVLTTLTIAELRNASDHA